MGAEGALDILREIQALVSDRLQVVSYKWLSRNFSVSSNDAKRLLQDFVSKYGEGLEVIYALSGWLKESPQVYNIRLVPSSRLSEAKKDLREKCSVHVYSVQASIPKDPAAIWNVEFVQAEELFDQPLTLTNCLRDNRFCGVSNSSVKRSVNGKSVVMDPVLNKKVEVSSVSPKIEPIPDNPNLGKEKVDSSSLNERKAEGEEVKQEGGKKSLTNLWGRASAKSKPPEITDISKASAMSDGQIYAQEALDSISSDDEWQLTSQKETSGRKRRVVFDSSDEENEADAVDLSVPELSNCQSEPGQRNIDAGCQNGEVNTDGKSAVDAVEGSYADNSSVKYVSTSPKKSKVLKTRIDERGREVTEVFWEGDAAETVKADITVPDSTIRERPPPAPKPSPAVPRHPPSVPGGKAGGGRTGKAGGSKDAKQPNILSFFKKT